MGAITKLSDQPRDYNASQLALIKRTLAADCNDQEFDLFIEHARRYRLDPFRKQITVLVFNKDKPDKRRIAIITTIDGLRAIAADGGDYRPDDSEPQYEYGEKDEAINPLGLIKAAVRCYKRDSTGEWFPLVGVAYWDEFVPLTDEWKTNETGKRYATGVKRLDKRSNWYTMPRLMLAKVAEAQALRKGWPERMGGLHADDEMARAQASDEVAAYEQDERMKLIGSKDAIPMLWEPGAAIEMVPVGVLADRCFAHVAACKSMSDLTAWRDTNTAGLREFWAKSRSDAMAVKKAIDERLVQISMPAPQNGTEEAPGFQPD